MSKNVRGTRPTSTTGAGQGAWDKSFVLLTAKGEKGRLDYRKRTARSCSLKE